MEASTVTQTTERDLTPITTALRRLSEGAQGILSSDANSDQKLNAIVMAMATNTAADLLEQFQRRDIEMRSAIEVALASLADTPDGQHIAAVLTAAVAPESLT
jgi:aspartate/glutamate racemase